MNTLHLTLKKKYFDAIARGEKREEYREDKTYWRRRLILSASGAGFRTFNYVEFCNGYRPECPRMLVQCLGISREHLVVEGLGGGQAASYFVIKLGSILEYTSAAHTVYPQLRRGVQREGLRAYVKRQIEKTLACPTCGQAAKITERRIDGDSWCVNGHKHKTKDYYYPTHVSILVINKKPAKG